MTNFKEQFNELTQLTQLYLLQEYTMNDRIKVASENFSYFKKQAALAKKAHPKESTIPSLKVNSPPPAQAIIDSPRPKTAPEPLMSLQEIKPEPLPMQKAAAKPAEASSHVDTLKVEPLQPSKPSDFSELRNIIKEQAPHLKIFDEIRMPKMITPKEVVILFLTRSPAENELLNNMAKAIQLKLAPTRLIEASSMELNKEWDRFLNSSPFKLIIIPQSDLNKLPELSKFSKRNEQQTWFLNEVPTLLIPDPELLNHNPSLKQQVWKSLQNYLKPTE